MQFEMRLFKKKEFHSTLENLTRLHNIRLSVSYNEDHESSAVIAIVPDEIANSFTEEQLNELRSIR